MSLFVGLLRSYLFLRWRAKLLGLAGSESSRHVECLHHIHVPGALVALETTHKISREGHNGLDPVTQLTVTQILQKVTQLKKVMREILFRIPKTLEKNELHAYYYSLVYL